LVLTDNASGSPQTVSLTGTGVAPAVSLSATSLSYVPQLVGTSSSAQTLTLTNTGSAPLSITSVTIGPDYGQTNTCGVSVPAQGSCTFTVTFTPTLAGSLNESLVLTDNANGSPHTVALSGTGVIPIGSVSPSSLGFGNQQLGTTSGPQNVTLSNTGSAALSITSILTTGNFAVSSNTCGGSLAPGATCQIGVTFSPQVTGPLTGTLTVTDNSSTGSTQSVGLRGTGLAYSPNLLSYAVYATGSGCGAINMSGGGFTDSFDSSQGSYSQTHQNTSGNVGVTGNISLSSSTVNGTISALNTAVGSCINGTPGISLYGSGKATGGYVLLSAAPSFPSPVAVNPGTKDYSFTKSGSLSPGNYHNIIVQSGSTLTLSPGTYNVNSITLSGNSIVTISPAGQVIINFAGNGVSNALNASGGSLANPSGIPLNLQLIYGGSLPTILSGGSMSYGLVYAPNSALTLSGNGGWYGAMAVKTLTDSGGSAIHYDRSL